ncbi:MAG: aminoglycoside phosphotransferase family protein [Lachnospiraceae bacterium]|nr:aminoglycoside phosphotransferase family protein [Lachnospiraceae bacterium]
MERIRGLREYTQTAYFKEALEIPRQEEVEFRLLAQGEYNINYEFWHPVRKERMLLRVNCQSQMHLKHQIEYEANALQLLKSSGRVPGVYFVDGSKKKLDHGIMVMEYLPGRALNYHKDLEKAAEILADIHSVEMPEKCGLIHPKDPLRAILEECEAMVKTYMESPFGKEHTKKKIRMLLDREWKRIAAEEGKRSQMRHCCINTELNSTNFLINAGGRSDYLIDWEKPLLGEVAQDLGHFLAPTTTFWKTDVILSHIQTEEFLETYIEKVGGRFSVEGLKERVHNFVPVTCMRGITWCAMAWIQYRDPEKLIINESTLHKLEAYLSDAFLGYIEERSLTI